MKTRKTTLRLRHTTAFTLVEVVIALAILVFVLVGVLGLLGLGVTNSKVSSDQIQAANLASLLLGARRAAPTNSTGYFSTFAIPPLTTFTTNSVAVGINGSTVTGTMPASDVYNLKYIITPGATPNLSAVYLLLWWPASAALPTTNTSGTYYEIATQIPHP